MINDRDRAYMGAGPNTDELNGRIWPWDHGAFALAEW